MPSLFLDICVAIYAYTAQSPQELSLIEGDVLYILDKSSEDDWWKAKKRMVGAEDDEPIGLVPNNYVESMKSTGKAKALYDYDRQTEEEANLKENEVLDVYDTSDPDWVLVGIRDEYGFAPSNYIEYISEETAQALTVQNASAPPTPMVASPQQYFPPSTPTAVEQPMTPFGQPSYYQQDQQNAAYAQYREPEPEYDDDEEAQPEEPVPRLPSRPRASTAASMESVSRKSGFLTWNVQEVDSKRKKYKATLAIGNGSILFSPESASSSPQQWSITNLVNYNSEKKHVFLEFEHPSMSLDLHTGSKDNSAEIISAIGELVGAKRATGLREVIEASVPGGQKFGKVLYDFDAQGDDEVTVREGDDVFILDDKKSDEWWMIRHSLTGREGVVPSNYIEVIKKPTRSSSLPQETDRDRPKRSKSQRNKRRDSVEQSPPSTPAKPRPDPSKIRTWTDVSGTFKVEAAFVGCVDGKIQLHKVNGVKIAVAVNKMSPEDLDYVERLTGQSLRQKSPSKLGAVATNEASQQRDTLTAENPDRPGFDWFEFFLSCGVDVNNCQRYAISFEKDQMDESVLPDITPSVMRMLGLKEGDILRVNHVVEEKYSKKKRSVSFGNASVMGNDDQNGDAESGLFTDVDGSLKNNTQKSRPTPAVTTSSTVDGALLASDSSRSSPRKESGKLSPEVEDKPAQPPRPNSVPAQEPLTGALRDLTSIAPLTPEPASSLATPALVPQSTAAAAPPQVASVTATPVLSPGFTGQQAQPQAQYVAIQPRISIQPAMPGQFAMAAPQMTGIQLMQPTGMVAQPTQQPSQMIALPTGQISMQTGMQQPQMFFGVQRPSAPPQLSTATTATIPPPTTNGAVMGQPTDFQLQQQPMIHPNFAPPFANPQQNGFGPQPSGFIQGQQGFDRFAAPSALQPQPTRPFVPQSQFGIQQMQTGFTGPMDNGFRQPMNNGFQQPIINGFSGNGMSSALQSQPTGFGFGNGPQMPPPPGGVNSVLMKPLQPTKTGPPPKVSFGINKPLESTPTGIRKANLAAATAENPFGF
ncbi:hypothetical protein V1512DRAFT_263569 [Lipomyces arxii]|uniref:uncharacterized protein n=1 Tax=Lipomyces arxii TaxID=56418 RepID=UPI0034CE9968